MPTEFPSKRLAKCGATKGEIAVMRREFDRSDLGMQRSIASGIAEMAEGDVRALLANRRKSGVFDSVVEPDEAKATLRGRLFRREKALEAPLAPDDDEDDLSGHDDVDDDEKKSDPEVDPPADPETTEATKTEVD